jgi:endonuclease YncB( thermonuclease family)
LSRFRLLATLLLLPSALLAQQPPRSWAAVVTHVSDGDTVWVRPARGGSRVAVRLLDIDAPEICQRSGTQSRDALAHQVLRRTVTVEERGRDDFGRVLARLHRSGQDVGERLVAEGHAWSYRFRNQPGPYHAQEAQARQARRGLWAAAHPLEPRAFRRLHGPCDDKR